MKPVMILLADDHTIVRQGLKAILDAEPDLHVVGEVSDGREAVQAVRSLRPGVVVMDIAMPGLNGIEATRQIASLPGAPRVIILSMYADVEHVLHALEAGAAGYVRKQDADAELVAAVRGGDPGKPFLSPSVDRELVEEHRRRAEVQTARQPQEYEPLTPREREVLQLVAEGRPNKQIASILGIAVRTVEAHRASIMRKLSITDQASLVRYAVRKGIVSMDE
ncbi:MAG: response regulator transcription factor [Armatimonadota bacterium]|nr:MAG: response regulator transcription factor [Armatimonadota bacterium]